MGDSEVSKAWVVNKAIHELKPYPNNSKIHTVTQLEGILESIKQFGFKQPIVIDKDNVIIAGHGRYEAAATLGWEFIPCIIADDLDEEQVKAYRILDNKLAEGGTDIGKLQAELANMNFDFSDFKVNFEEININVIPEKEFKSDENSIPELKAIPTSKVGDLWILGEHRVCCGDSTSVINMELLMQGERASICFTSPPYNVGKNSTLNANKAIARQDNKYQSYNDSVTDQQYLTLLQEFSNTAMTYSECLIVNIQMLAGNKITLIDYLNLYKNNLIDVAIWDKGHAAPAMAENVLNSCFEFLFFLTLKDNPKRTIPTSQFRGTIDNVYRNSGSKSNEFSGVHAATFPVHLPEWIISSFDKTPGSIILDPFGGTGTTLIACEKLDRKARLMELDPTYCDLIITRWEKFTGKKALHENGKSFAELSQLSENIA